MRVALVLMLLAIAAYGTSSSGGDAPAGDLNLDPLAVAPRGARQ